MRPESVYEEIESGESLLAPRREFSVRALLFYGLVAVVFGIFAIRIVHLQTVRGDELRTMADENRFRTVLTDAARGIIYDRTGLALVRNIPSYNVTIIPAYVPDDDTEAMAMYERLSALIDVPITTTITMEPSPDSKLLFQRPGLHDLSEPSPAYLVPVENKGIRELVELASTFEPYEPTLIKADIDRKLAQEIEELRPWLPGVEIEVVPVREYPTGELTSHLVGYMGPLPSDDYLEFGYEKTDRVGYAGIESVLEADLSGTKGEREIEVDVAGKEIRSVGPAIDPVPGVNVYLTIDTRLQAAATRALTRTINAVNQLWDIKLEQGVVIAMDPQSGEILAMVSIPTYDNNRFSTRIDLEYYQSLLEDIYNPLVNHAVSGQFPPGSTFKLVTASGALEDGIITQNTRIIGEGTVYLENKYAPNDPGQAQPFYCWYREGHGALTILGGIAQSCNIFFYKVGGGFPEQNLEGLGDQRLAWYAKQFGYSERSGIELLGEATGHIPDARWKRLTYGESWSTGDTYNMAVGQGFVTATPLQVLNMGATVASGGTLYRPQIVHHLTDATGNVVRVTPDGETSLLTDAAGNPIPPPRDESEMDLVFEPEVIRWLEVSPQNLALVQEGMRRAVTEGTAKAASLDDYGIHVAAKTGTAEFCDNLAIRRGWCREGWPLPTHAWTVAYAPYEDPEIAVVAFVYNGGEGSAVAVPIVRQLLEAYFEVGRYAPSEAADGGLP
jgi:penicillin-binding protein 2